MIKGIHHVALRFYRDLIGVKVKCSWGEGHYAATMLELNGDAIYANLLGRTSE